MNILTFEELGFGELCVGELGNHRKINFKLTLTYTT